MTLHHHRQCSHALVGRLYGLPHLKCTVLSQIYITDNFLCWKPLCSHLFDQIGLFLPISFDTVVTCFSYIFHNDNMLVVHIIVIADVLR
eukprot:CCRYP_016756-RA/>CCRYP_016756-RA protein AED:0.47 eAED:0.47 QI:371/1/0.5/1/0/0/2/0/88